MQVRIVTLVASFAVASGAFAQQPPPREVDPANFVSGVDNPFVPLVPGTVYHYEGFDEGEPVTVDVTVTHDIRMIQGVACVIVHDRAYADGVLVEDTFDWYAQDKSGTVWYFGEDTRTLDPLGNVISTEGSWEAGVDGARAGIIMLAIPRVHAQYYQEYAPGVALDKARVLSLDEETTVQYGVFEDLVQTREWSRLDPGVLNHKFYAEGIGLVLDEVVRHGEERLELVSIDPPSPLESILFRSRSR